MRRVLLTSESGFFSSTWSIDTRNKYKNFTLSRSKKKIKTSSKNFKVNFNNTKDVEELVSKIKPNIILHTAAITGVDLCEEDQKLSKKINYDLTKKISNICKRKKIKLIFISTDQVFSRNLNNLETQKKSPTNIYSLHKSMAEEYILNNLQDYLIIRTNFFGIAPKSKKSFINFIFLNLTLKKKINLITDVIHNPISIHLLIKYIINLINVNAFGVFHISSNEKISKYQLGMKIFKIFNLNNNFVSKSKLSNFSFKARRPNYMYLNNRKIKKFLKIKIPSIQDQLKDIKKRYVQKYYKNFIN